jgi:hypothetical protein
MTYQNEYHEKQAKALMAAQAAQPRQTPEEVTAQYDKICGRRKPGINMRARWRWRMNQLMSK